VWIVSLEPTQGDEITKIRRCAVVSTDRFSQRVGVLGSELVEDIAATIKPCLF
jgi:mRNA-degrading endonuclease toxin of MazEF toxin-antitoxin module